MTSFDGPLIPRVLTIDDNPDIHEDFKKILNRETNADTALAAEEALLLGDALPQNEDTRFELSSALQGEAGVELASMGPGILVASSFLPRPAPRDPADRILAATARILNYRLMTRDKGLLEFAAAGHLDAIAC